MDGQEILSHSWKHDIKILVYVNQLWKEKIFGEFLMVELYSSTGLCIMCLLIGF